MTKLIATCAITLVYEQNPDDYDDDLTLEEMIEIDKTTLEEDPILFLDRPEAEWTFSIVEAPTADTDNDTSFE